ncbi:MAG TPA: hypothetical protein VML36_02510 [Nitrospiria bacterium]|nr:hypothetical protein [Nitrospiria bacterium]
MAVVTRRIMANRGGALVLVLLVLLLFTLLGAAAVQMGHQELVQGGLQFAQQEAGDLAESGIELAIGWFARPDAFNGMVARSDFPCPAAETPRELLAKRCRRETGRLSFLTDDGESQFHGTPAAPDGIMRLDASTLLPIAVAPAARATIEVALFRPTIPGAICTVQSTGRTAGGASRMIRVELYEAAVPVLTAAAGAAAPGPSVGPVRIHWGALRYHGDGRLPADPDDAPYQSSLAPVNGEPYGAAPLIDRWMEAVIGGRLLEPQSDSPADSALVQQWSAKGNVRIGATVPSDAENWSYQELKGLARRFGRYYTTDREGRLYRDGLPPPMEADTVFGEAADPEKVLFIDTVDGLPPRPGEGGNLAVITLSRSVGRHPVYLGADLVLAPSAAGKSPLLVPSPLGDETMLALEAIDYSGAYYIAGRLTVLRESRLYGAVYAVGGFEGTRLLELWYDRRYGLGRWPDWPVALIVPGSWQVLTP